MSDDTVSVPAPVETVETKPADAGSGIDELFDKIDDIASRVAAIEEVVSALVPHVGAFGKIFGLADEIASVFANLRRGRVQT